MVNHMVIIPRKLELGMAPCPRLCCEVAEARTPMLSNYLRPGALLPSMIISRMRCASGILWCPPAWATATFTLFPEQLSAHNHCVPGWLCSSPHIDQVLLSAPLIPTAAFLRPQPYAYPILQFTPGCPSSWKCWQTTPWQQRAGRCMLLWVGKFFHLAVLPDGKQTPIQSMKERVSSGSLSYCLCLRCQQWPWARASSDRSLGSEGLWKNQRTPLLHFMQVLTGQSWVTEIEVCCGLVHTGW